MLTAQEIANSFLCCLSPNPFHLSQEQLDANAKKMAEVDCQCCMDSGCSECLTHE